MKAKLLLIFLAIALVAFSIVLLVPSARAQMQPLLRWFKFEGPVGGEEVSISMATEFTPLRPTYLPSGFEEMVVGLNPESAVLRYWNQSTGQILLIDETPMFEAKPPLPAGKQLTINGQPAVLIEGLSGNLTFVLLPPTPAPPLSTPQTPEAQPSAAQSAQEGEVKVVSYHDAKQLIWDIDNLRIQITSNLPLEEILKVAESFVSAEEPNPPLKPGAQEPNLP
ncbi:MAG: DUF4367 domain-containing protein [Anaerolineales bacterium]|nr:DUF4367 domain-containing protein [Anaerolineales bacterium]MDW8446032.1 DUF4367 domain-containing protein [Anaerolineales bacterium]